MDSSTFGGSALSNTALQGAQQSFFAGQDYRNNEIQNTLNRRNNLFSNNIGLAQQQNALDVNRGLGLEGIKTQRLNDLNSFNLGNAQLGGQFNLGAASQLGTMDQNNQNRNFLNSAYRSQNLGNLAAGGLGLAGGFAFTDPGQKLAGKIGSGVKNFFSF